MKKFNCDECHSGPYYTDMKMHRIGEDIEFENGWDTPTLREVWRTALIFLMDVLLPWKKYLRCISMALKRKYQLKKRKNLPSM